MLLFKLVTETQMKVKGLKFTYLYYLSLNVKIIRIKYKNEIFFNKQNKKCFFVKFWLKNLNEPLTNKIYVFSAHHKPN